MGYLINEQFQSITRLWISSSLMLFKYDECNIYWWQKKKSLVIFSIKKRQKSSLNNIAMNLLLLNW